MVTVSGRVGSTRERARVRNVVRGAMLCTTALVGLGSATRGLADTYAASDAASLAAAINSANAHAGLDTISLTGNISLSNTLLPVVMDAVTIDGGGSY